MKCPACGAENEYIRIMFTSVECTNDQCDNYCPETMAEWVDSLYEGLDKDFEDFDWTTVFLDYSGR